MMNRGQNSDSVPIDLILEILPRLPAKSIGRFRCVSKQWGSMLSCPEFTKLFLTRSSACPRLLFAVKGDRKWSFYSSPNPQNLYKKSSLVAAADFHIKIHGYMYRCIYTSGLIYFPEMWLSKDYEDTVPVICNPITGQYAILPKLRSYRNWCSFFRFDPIDNQFKVLLMGYPHHRILTLGTGEMRWREMEFPALFHWPCSEGICINGVLYYLGDVDETYAVIVCFDVRSEKFKFVDSPSKYTKLINYKGKLGEIKLTNGDGVDAIELLMWVLEDVEKQEWSEHVYTLPEKVDHLSNISVDGVTATCEIVLSKRNTCKPFYVFYFNLERNTLQSVEIQGFENESEVFPFVDHVEDLNLNNAKQLKSSRSSRRRPEYH